MNKAFETYKKIWSPIVVGGSLGLLCALFFLGGIFDTWNARLTDRLFVSRKADERIVVVAIDDASIKQVGRWPWDRSVHAELIRKISKAGAGVIAYDVNFSEAQNGEMDSDLASAIRASRRVILPTELSISEIDGRLIADQKKVISPLPVFEGAAIRTGFSNTPPDIDGVVRRIPLRVFLGGERSELYPFAFEAAQAFDTSMSVASAPMDTFGRVIVAYPGTPKNVYPTISAGDILADRFQENDLKGKLVFVGSTASDLHDEQFVPTSLNTPMPGVEIHAAYADTMLERRWIRTVSPWMFALGLFCIGLFNGWIVSRLRMRWSLFVLSVLFACSLVFSIISFELGLVLNILWIALTIITTSVGVIIERRVAAERDRRSLRQVFEHYVSPAIVDLIVRDPSKLKLGGERRQMTVLFSDIRVFTALTETTEPEALIHKLNVYFSQMTAEVFNQSGVLDKYMGDGLMAFWNAPFDQKDHALKAVECALAMQQSLVKLNQAGAFGNPPWNMGIGINTGEVIVGNIGGENHADYTVIGDAVNLASRLERLTREYKVWVIVSEATAKELEGRMLLRRIDRVVVKGRFQTVTIYEVICEMSRATDLQKELVQTYEKMLDLYCEKNFDEVIFQCHQILTKQPNDGPTQVMYDRARTFLTTPPPMGWDGTWVFTEK